MTKLRCSRITPMIGFATMIKVPGPDCEEFIAFCSDGGHPAIQIRHVMPGKIARRLEGSSLSSRDNNVYDSYRFGAQLQQRTG